ncbi:hypothetical protein SCOR_20305 [Sulfidibacter corallicola]
MTGGRKRPAGESSDELQNVYNEDGVDLTLIRWMLSLSLEERLQVLQDHVNSIQMMRRELTISA